MVIVLVSGPQATGKTTLAMVLGRTLAAPVFSRDPLMTVLWEAVPVWRRLPGWVPATGLRLQTALFARQLELGQSAVLECIVPPGVRQHWRAMTIKAGHRFVSVECVCSDGGAHRARYERRAKGQAWERVAATMHRYRPDDRPDFVADAVRPVDDLVADIVDLIRRGEQGVS